VIPAKERADDRTTGEWRRTGPLPAIEPARRSGYERHGDREEGGRRQSSFNEGDGKVRDFGNWERKGPLSPLAPTSPTGDRPRVGDREFRRRSPVPSADGDRSERGHGFRERPAVERQPSAAEKDNEWRRGARPDVPPQRSAPASPVLAHTRPKLELKKRSEQPIETETPATGSDRPNPFGGARPIDTTQREREVEERRVAAAAERKALEEKAREKKAAHEAEEKASEAGTPVVRKNFDTPRRGSGSTNDSGAPADTEKEKPAERKKATPTKGSDNWRSRKEQSKQPPKQEGEADGWTVAGKRKGRESGSKPVSAQ
jgi:translation initiation factor 4B